MSDDTYIIEIRHKLSPFFEWSARIITNDGKRSLCKILYGVSAEQVENEARAWIATRVRRRLPMRHLLIVNERGEDVDIVNERGEDVDIEL